jgi:membrane protein YqaA with SNARE-associated domain
VAGFAFLAVLVGALGYGFRDELSWFGAWFVSRFGLAGIIAGAFLADGLRFPLPPQFYLLTGIAGGNGRGIVLASVLIGCELGGFFAYGMSRWIAKRSHLLNARLARSRELVSQLMERHHHLGLVVAALLPISYWALCVVAGAMRLSYSQYLVLAFMRIPRIRSRMR